MGEVLLIRVDGYDFEEFPKGHAEKDESLEDVAKRETEEETGYLVETTRRLSDVTYEDKIHGDSVRLALFQAKPIKKSGKGENNIHPHWVSLNEAKKLIYPDLISVLGELTR